MKNNKWTEKEINFLLNNYKDKSNKQLAQELNRSNKAIEIKLTRLGLTRPKIHIQNNEAFSSICSEEQAYWLGFITADGFLNYNLKNGTYELGIELNSMDFQHLVKFKNFLQSNAPVIIRRRHFNIIAGKVSNKDLYTARIRIYSKQIIEDLIKLKIYPKKTKVGIYYLETLPEELQRHYIRGFFDGDGSIWWKTAYNKKKYLCCNFTSVEENFLIHIREQLYSQGIYSYITSWNNSYNHITYQLGLSGKENCLNFLKYIYEDSNVFLDRKYLLFKKAALNSDV